MSAPEPTPRWYWHVHHEQLAEPLTEPIENRLAYIKSDKPKTEQATRLKWMTPILGEVPAVYVKAGAVYVKAWAASVKARAASVLVEAAKAGAAYDKAWAVYVKARAVAQPALEALHAIEHPGCPWDGRTIFPRPAVIAAAYQQEDAPTPDPQEDA